ncbi:MAG: LysR substrate-binding domain-containing protein, partial [Pseudomonadota bacterium]
NLGMSLYASKDYVAKHGMPQNPEDLDEHSIISYGDERSPMQEVNWAQRIGRDDKRPREPNLRVNNVFAMLRAVDAGLGIADVPDYMAATNSNLIKVLENHAGPSFELYFIYPSDLRRSKRISTFRNFLTDQIEPLRRANRALQ